jgi:hypothetical protein
MKRLDVCGGFMFVCFIHHPPLPSPLSPPPTLAFNDNAIYCTRLKGATHASTHVDTNTDTQTTKFFCGTWNGAGVPIHCGRAPPRRCRT